MDYTIETINKKNKTAGSSAVSSPAPVTKKKKRLNRLVRAGIQVFFFFAAPAIFTTAFSGIRYIALQFAGHEILELNTFLKTLIIMLLYTIVFGRFICGYACPFGSAQDGLYGLTTVLMKKAGKNRKRKHSAADTYLVYTKYIILAGIVLLCFTGAFSGLQIYSPWNAFSQITSHQFRFQGLAVSGGLMAAALAGSCLKQRFFCRFFCPMGAVFALMPVLPFGKLNKDKENCLKGCRACKNNCPVGIDLAADAASGGECISCNACQDICPMQNVHTGMSKKVKGNELLYVIIKAASLYMLYLIIMKLWQ